MPRYAQEKRDKHTPHIAASGTDFHPRKSNPSPGLVQFLAALILGITFAGELTAVDLNNIFQEAPNVETLSELYNAGEYEHAIDYATKGQEIDSWIDDWEVVKSKSLLALGRYEEAFQSLQNFVGDRNYELRPRLLLREAALFTNRMDEAQRQKEALGYIVNERSRRYSYDPENIVAVGKVALLYDVEPKIVLENFYRRAEEIGIVPVSAILAIGDLALSKHDYKLASLTYQRGLETHSEVAEIWYGLARSFQNGDTSKLIEYAERALTINPRHSPTRVLVAEHLINAEAYDKAEEQLDLALAVNPLDPDALALKSSIAFIRNETSRGEELRTAALSTWRSNPQVDFRIGQQLSRKYRFEDGAASQRSALILDKSYNPSRIQLAQDLLRLGRNREAWTFADAVYQSDPYDIAAYNLVTLRDRLEEFETLESSHFLLRLSTEEASVYGPRAIRLLEDAHARLTDRYGMELPQKTTVEIYQNPADFETRTFGMPGNPGFLGVCFGPVFTINSPATRSANWEAVLFHEFCHTITLSLTNNRMPRWLSEGISVYEEQEANPAWGQRMSADYRDRILSDRMQPISSMSSAFLQAQGGEDIQFAYFQSYLVVEYLIQTYGTESLRELLVELGRGTEINQALTLHLAPIKELDAGFSIFAKETASELASDFRFESNQGPLGLVYDSVLPKTNYTAALKRAREHLSQENWSEAISELETLVSEAGYLPGEENAHWPLAQAYQGIGDTEKEISTLATITEHEASRLPAVTRLLELSKSGENQPEVLRWSDAWIAINPMAETPWRAMLTSAGELDRMQSAVESAQSLLALKTPDAPSLHFQLAELLKEQDAHAAKRHILMALEEAPRFQKAYELLAQLQDATKPKPPTLDPITGLDLNNDFTN